jgi:hypothetical protein
VMVVVVVAVVVKVVVAVVVVVVVVWTLAGGFRCFTPVGGSTKSSFAAFVACGSTQA